MSDDDDDDMRDLFDEPARARSTDPWTSHAAKEFNLNEDRVAVLLVHSRHPFGLTDFELASNMDRQQTSVGKRRGELRDHGYIEQTPIKRNAPSGAMAIVWRITPRGQELAKRFS